MSTPSVDPIAVLDTSVQIDRIKSRHWKEHVEDALKGFKWTISTGISLLEFKAVLLQECITIHNRLVQLKKFTLVRDSLIESTHPQSRLRAHIFNNLINVFGSSQNIDDATDEKLGEKARLSLEIHIPELYKWFRTESASSHHDPIGCNRAMDPPVKKKAAYAPNLPVCKRGVNKNCKVENFIKSNGPPLLLNLRKKTIESEQLENAVGSVEAFLKKPNTQFSSSDCRRIGDLLITLEGKDIACSHAVSTNARDWVPLTESSGMTLVRIEHQKLCAETKTYEPEA